MYTCIYVFHLASGLFGGEPQPAMRWGALDLTHMPGSYEYERLRAIVFISGSEIDDDDVERRELCLDRGRAGGQDADSRVASGFVLCGMVSRQLKLARLALADQNAVGFGILPADDVDGDKRHRGGPAEDELLRDTLGPGLGLHDHRVHKKGKSALVRHPPHLAARQKGSSTGRSLNAAGEYQANRARLIGPHNPTKPAGMCS